MRGAAKKNKKIKGEPSIHLCSQMYSQIVHLYSKMQAYLRELGGLPHDGDRLKERGQPIIGRLAGESGRRLRLR